MTTRLASALAVALVTGPALLSQQIGPPVFQWPDGTRMALSLSFDDARISQVEGGTALLERHGIRATFYVTPSGVEKRLEGWRQAAARGHEIGNHSVNHPCSGNFVWARDRALEDYTLVSIREELVEGNQRIATLVGVAPPESFAYPCGQTFVGRDRATQSYVPVAASLFVTARGWLDEAPNDPAYVDFAQLTGLEADGKDFAEIRPILDSARKTGAWVVLAGHEMGRGGAQTTRLSMLEDLAAYVNNPANGVWTAPVGSVARYVRDARARAGIKF